MQIPPTPDIDLTLRRNCSISPQALARVLMLLAAVSLGIGIGFALLGAWMILPFAGIEVIALAVAFVLHARHVCDYERISADGERLWVEVRDGEGTSVCRFERRWVRIDERADGSVALAARGVEVEIGRHMDGARRHELAAALRRRLVTG